jgi:transposase
VRCTLRPKAPCERPRRESALDPFRPLIRKLVLTDGLSCVRVLEKIREVGYRSGYSILTDYVRTFRPTPIQTPHLRFETAPGVQGQVDLSPYKVLLSSKLTPVVCFSMVLGYSRWQFIRFVLHADVHSVCHCHVLAFEAAGGVSEEILYDRMKQVVLESHKDGVIYHPFFESLVHHYGFRAIPLAPGYKEGKGKVENPFRYVEGNFLAGRTFHDLDDLNRQAAEWLAQTAWVRVHRTTREQPVSRLAEEQPALIPLPDKRFEAGVVLPRLVGDDFCVAWETNRYSVPPHFAGRAARVRVLEGRLEVLVGDDVIAAHEVRATEHKRYVAPEHEAEFRRTSTSRHVLAEQFQRLGPISEAFAAGLIETRGAAAGYHMGQILKLADRVGGARITEALRHAARYGAFDYNAVARIVAGKPSSPRSKTRESAAFSGSHIDQVLKGTGVHQRSLDGYRKLADMPDPSSSKSTKEDDNGQ